MLARRLVTIVRRTPLRGFVWPPETRGSMCITCRERKGYTVMASNCSLSPERIAVVGLSVVGRVLRRRRSVSNHEIPALPKSSEKWCGAQHWIVFEMPCGTTAIGYRWADLRNSARCCDRCRCKTRRGSAIRPADCGAHEQYLRDRSRATGFARTARQRAASRRSGMASTILLPEGPAGGVLEVRSRAGSPASSRPHTATAIAESESEKATQGFTGVDFVCLPGVASARPVSIGIMSTA
jgi:hypothetical protein